MTTPVLEPLGDAAVRAALPEGADARAVLEALRASPGVIDAVVTERHLAVVLDPAAPRGDLPALVARALEARAPARTPREHVVRVRYDGEDLAEVAARAGLDAREVARAHAARAYVVRMIGFLPGFAYLAENDPRLAAVPRRPSPRARVPAGSVAIAARYTGIYPFASPGGWSLMATVVDFVPFDPARGAALALGDRVRFEAVT